jgi:hypothetical protein
MDPLATVRSTLQEISVTPTNANLPSQPQPQTAQPQAQPKSVPTAAVQALQPQPVVAQQAAPVLIQPVVQELKTAQLIQAPVVAAAAAAKPEPQQQSQSQSSVLFPQLQNLPFSFLQPSQSMLNWVFGSGPQFLVQNDTPTGGSRPLAPQGTRPTAPTITVSGFPHTDVIPLANPFAGSSFEGLPFPYNPYGAPYLGTPMSMMGMNMMGMPFWMM